MATGWQIGVAGLTAGLLLLAPCVARSEPVEIQAKSMALDDTKHEVRFNSDVRLVRGDFQLHCDRLIGHYKQKSSELQRAEAYGHVRMQHGTSTGSADQANLDNTKGTVTLIGHAILEQGGRRIEGNSIVHDLRQQQTAVTTDSKSRARMTLESGEDNEALIPQATEEPKP